MSGSTAKQGLGAFGIAASVASAPFTGGASLAGLPASVAAFKSGSDQAAAQAKRESTALRNNLIKPITPVTMPTVDNAAVQKAKANELTQLQNRSGRASTVLTNQFGG